MTNAPQLTSPVVRLKTAGWDYGTVRLSLASYPSPVGLLALIATPEGSDDPDATEQWLTANPGRDTFALPGWVALDVNNHPGIAEALTDLGVLGERETQARSGFVLYPIHELTEASLEVLPRD